jgi:NAD-dependent deacetylase
LKRPKRIVVLTGAGVSAESGLSTFRDRDGIWAQHDWRAVATPEGFAANPALVHDFYNRRRQNLQSVHVNAAHWALAALEERLAAAGGKLTLVTQNVDDLHERAGSRNLIHMHGELTKARCSACEAARLWDGALSVATACPSCGRTGCLRPHVVWFGETPFDLDRIAAEIARADLFASIGTSGSVYPAAGFAAEARSMNIPCTELNLEPSENAWVFSDGRYGKAGEIVPAWAMEICP